MSVTEAIRQARLHLSMMKYLIENEAKLVATSNDSHPCQFLQFLLELTPSGRGLFRKVQYIVGNFIDFGHPFTPSQGLLGASLWGNGDFINNNSEERLKTFEFLLQEGAKVNPGASLVPLILKGGQEQLVQALISAGADIHAYFCLPGTQDSFQICMSPLQAAVRMGREQFIQQLIGLGTKVDEWPLPNGATTALQTVCMFQSRTSEENLRRIRIIRLLLEHGAAVNGPPGGDCGYTALHSAAMLGTLDFAVLLLGHGADINASEDGLSALDFAARFGCMDMVQFLLNANAVSGRPGQTGYDGAIAAARSGCHFAVAKLLERHAENNTRRGIVNPSLSCRQENIREDLIYESSSGLGVVSLEINTGHDVHMTTVSRRMNKEKEWDLGRIF